MWLLRTDVLPLQLVQFIGDPTEPYAIFSHTWGKDEVLFADIGKVGIDKKIGYRKLLYALEQAALDGNQYIWVDTCCIDKSSSAELSEAINSMFFHYQQAAVCYAYLSDIELVIELPQSRWFTRGWTLQELLAPKEVMFYNLKWSLLGTKHTLTDTLSDITGIEKDILVGTKNVTMASIAQRMSWASKRRTTRIEDSAYCLLGIFGVNMPLLYGERNKAFMRLQDEIVQTTDDQTLFAWSDPDAAPHDDRGLLATSPRCFANSSVYEPDEGLESREPYNISKGRLKIQVGFTHPEDAEQRSCELESPCWFVTLACKRTDGQNSHAVMISLRLVSWTRREFSRTHCSTLLLQPHIGKPESIFVPLHPRSNATTYTPRSKSLSSIILRRCAVEGDLRVMVKGAAVRSQDGIKQIDGPVTELEQHAYAWLPDWVPIRYMYDPLSYRIILALHIGISTGSSIDKNNHLDVTVLFGILGKESGLFYAVLPDCSGKFIDTIEEEFFLVRSAYVSLRRLCSWNDDKPSMVNILASGASRFYIQLGCYGDDVSVDGRRSHSLVDLTFRLAPLPKHVKQVYGR